MYSIENSSFILSCISDSEGPESAERTASGLKKRLLSPQEKKEKIREIFLYINIKISMSDIGKTP
ncbi:MAG: hypothetical protein OHK0029_39910 [Armatimonadaceae bacterium]